MDAININLKTPLFIFYSCLVNIMLLILITHYTDMNHIILSCFTSSFSIFFVACYFTNAIVTDVFNFFVAILITCVLTLGDVTYYHRCNCIF